MALSFSEYIKKNQPQEIYLIREIADAIGKTPNWGDLTKANLLLCRKHWSIYLANNTVKKRLAIIGSIMRKNNAEVQLPKNFEEAIRMKKEATVNTYLTETEITMLEAVEPQNEGEEYIKSLFLLQYYTGCRMSDALKFDRSNIHERVLHYVSQKTKIAVVVPVKPDVITLIDIIMTKNKGGKVNRAVYGRNIKRLCYRAGIRATVKTYKGGQNISSPKYMVVSSHTARRSFATNLFLRGADVYTISKLMGHTNPEMTMGYICAQPHLTDNIMEFFN